MKFGKNLREKTLKEWRFYSVDYKALKKTLKQSEDDSPNTDEFFGVLEESESKLSKFYHDKEKWALGYLETLEERVQNLRDVASAPMDSPTEAESASSDSSISSEEEVVSDSSMEMDGHFVKLSAKAQSFGTKQCWLKEEYRRMGSSKEFKAFIYAKKSLATFDRELSLLLEFLELNKTAFSKILKKFDKRTGSSIREDKLADIMKSNAYLEGVALKELKETVEDLINEVNSLKPELPEGWENRKVYTIGCFDLFHRGHQNVLLSLREFGYYVRTYINATHSDSTANDFSSASF